MIFVAKSYEGLEKIGEPYLKSGRSYIKVLTKTGQEKEVRVYTEKEYTKMYPEAKVQVNSKPYGPQMNCLGWRDPDDFITIFCGNVVKNGTFFENYKPARYHKIWGWYLVGGILPNYEILPERVYPAFLPWYEVGNEDGYLKSDEEVAKAVKKLVKETYDYYASK